MGKYGETAVKAALYIRAGKDPRTAWETASCEIFERGSSLQVKGCPRNAFLGFYGGKNKNAEYAKTALAYLQSNPDKDLSERELWKIILGGTKKAYNQQMDVVLSLYRAGLI